MITGVILAGGYNLKLGGVLKPMLPFPEQYLIQRQIDIMKKICSEIIVVTNDPKPFLPVIDRSVRMITDFFLNMGPLGGMHAALSLSKNHDVWVVSVDMPFISDEVANLMWKKLKNNRADAVLPYVNSEVNVFHGIYHKHCAGDILSLLETGNKKVEDFLKKVHFEVFTDEEFEKYSVKTDFMQRIRSQDDYQHALKELNVAAP